MTERVDVVAVPSFNADGTVDQTPGYVTLSEEIPTVKGADDRLDEKPKAARAKKAKKGTRG